MEWGGERSRCSIVDTLCTLLGVGGGSSSFSLASCNLQMLTYLILYARHRFPDHETFLNLFVPRSLGPNNTCLEIRRENTRHILNTHAIVPWDSMTQLYAAVPRKSAGTSYLRKLQDIGFSVYLIIPETPKLWGQISSFLQCCH